MVQFSTFLNLLLVPAVSLYIQLYRLDALSVERFTIRNFLEYCIFTVLNIPVTKVLLKVFEILFHRSLSPDSIGGYTILALAVAAALPYLLRLCRKQFPKYLKIEKAAASQSIAAPHSTPAE